MIAFFSVISLGHSHTESGAFPLFCECYRTQIVPLQTQAWLSHWIFLCQFSIRPLILIDF